MAVNESRSLNGDLWEGLSDGVVKKDAPDRGGVVEYNAHMTHLLNQQYGVMAGMGASNDAAARIASL